MVYSIIVKPTGRSGKQVSFEFDPMLIGISGAMGMMPPYHTESGNANPRISKVVGVFMQRKVINF